MFNSLTGDVLIEIFNPTRPFPLNIGDHSKTQTE